MAKKTVSNFKLGIFVLAAVALLILLLYMVGKNKSLFASTFTLKVSFGNVQGLTPGNNVRYSGIVVGTVNRIRILNDGKVEVEMLIENKMKPYIRKNAVVTIATDGLMGDKVINITSLPEDADPVEDGDVLEARISPDVENMVNTLSGTNSDLAIAASELKLLLQKVNNSAALWRLLGDESLPGNLSASAANIRSATMKADHLIEELSGLVFDIKNGKGSLGAVLTDTIFADNLNNTVMRIQQVADQADTLANALSLMALGIRRDINEGKGPVNALLKDSAMVLSVQTSLENIRESTRNFNEVMEGLKHSFLVRGYFRRLEKRQQKEARKNQDHAQ